MRALYLPASLVQHHVPGSGETAAGINADPGLCSKPEKFLIFPDELHGVDHVRGGEPGGRSAESARTEVTEYVADFAVPGGVSALRSAISQNTKHRFFLHAEEVSDIAFSLVACVGSYDDVD